MIYAMARVRSLSRVGPLAALFFLAAGCGAPAAAPHPAPAGTNAEERAHWSYGGETGPAAWGRLSPEFALCETGTEQSPVNLANATPAELPDLGFAYQEVPREVVNTGHTLQVNYPAGSSMSVGGTTYQLLQFHFHTPAEHRLQGRELPMEIHFVHRGPQGDLAVVGVLVERGAANAAVQPLWSHLPARRGEERNISSVRIDPESLLPRDRQTYRYPGSLTTPPCTEGVKWFVFDEPIQMSAAQIEAVRSIIGTTNRPVQPLGNRRLLLDS
jgi:carbonic anhydrase